MAAEIFPLLSRATDANGAIYAGAKLYFYATGGLVAQDVFTTSALNVAHSQPVVADSGGNFAAVYLNAALTYRVILKNASGSVTILDRDPWNSGIDGVLGSAILFEQPGANADESDLQAKGRQTLTVLDYIPKSLHAAIRAGTDPTNHTAYVQAMDTDGIDVFRFPAGGYNMDTAYVPTHDQHWFGDGWGATTINCGVNGYIIETAASNKRVIPHDIYFLGDTANANGGCLKLYDPAGGGAYRCKFKDFNREAVRTVQAVQFNLVECLVENCGRAVTGTVTITNASPGVVTFTGHGLSVGAPVVFTTTGALPTGLTAERVYYIIAAGFGANSFQVSATEGGSAINTSSAGSGVHTCRATPYGAIHFDPGATASVHCHIKGGYISSCGIGVKGLTSRMMTIDGTTFESNTIGAKLDSSDGDVRARYGESNNIDADLTDSAGMFIARGVGDKIYQHYVGSAGKDRKIATGRAGYAEVYRAGTVTPGGTGFEDVSFVTLGDHYQVTCAVTAAPVTVDHAGVYEVRYRITFKADASARSVNMRLVADTGSGYAEVEGTNLAKSLAASEIDTLSGGARVSLPAAGAVKLQYSVSNVAVTLDASGAGGTAATHVTCAHLDIRHSGTEA